MSKKFSIKKRNKQKYNSEYCDDTMKFEDCELAILRHAVDVSEEIKGRKLAQSDDVIKIVEIVEKFITSKGLICYGGTAINNILPKYAQFYNRDIEIPDYDFFSANAMDDALELADIYAAAGYEEVEAKAGVHFGTYKVYVNFIPIADITYLQKPLFNAINKEAITVAGIKYAPPNFLRMSMYLELSRPEGDTSRWEKILKRLTLLNKYYPFGDKLKCAGIDFQREMSPSSHNSEQIYVITRDTLTDQGVIFFGGYASSLYGRYMTVNQQKTFRMIPDFDVISEEPEKISMILRERLAKEGFKNVYEVYHEPIGELVSEHYEICVGKDTIAFIFSSVACHSYNKIHINNKTVNVATIDTILSFYLAFIYTEQFANFRDRLLCMAKFLFEVEEKNRLEQKGLLKRFTMNCIGKQPTLEDVRAEKAEKFKVLKKDSDEYNRWFLKYVPGENKKKKSTKKTRKNKEPEIEKKTKVVDVNKRRYVKTVKKESVDDGLLY